MFSGAGYPNLVQHTVADGNVTTGLPYRFYIISENFVGLSVSASDTATHYACQAPSGLAPPNITSSTSAQVDLSWSPPTDDGGCTLTGYQIWVGDESAAASADAITYQIVNAVPLSADQNTLSVLAASLPGTAVAGSLIRFKLKAFNQGGFDYTSDRSARATLAGVPSTPTNGPVRDSLVTSAQVLKVSYSAPSSDGGSPISNYEVQMDDGLGGGFQTVAGGESHAYMLTSFTVLGGGSCFYNVSASSCITTQTSYGLDGQQYSEAIAHMSLTKGLAYRLRFRAANSIGWSGWSPISTVQVAKAPEPPQTPTIVATNSTSITVQVNPTLENNGDPVTSYAIYIDGGSLAS